MVKKKILIFVDWYKPGYKAGGPIRSVSNIVAHLKNQIEIFIITRDTDYLESSPYSSIKSDTWNNVDGASVFYLTKKNTSYKTIKRLVKSVTPNLIYVNSLYSPYYTLIPLLIAKKLKINSVIAVRGMLSTGSLDVKNKKKKLFLSIAKSLRFFNKCDFHATTQEEKEDIISTFGNKSNVLLAQNLPVKKTLPFKAKDKLENKLKLISVGRVAPEKNTLFAIDVLKEVKQNVSFDIYGPIYNQEYWNKCQRSINQMPGNIVINYKGVLPHEELDQHLEKYHVLFLPSTGENFGHIIIEAMMCSCVPIISDKTPWKNLENIKVGYDLPLTDHMLFATKVDKLAKFSKEEFNIFSANANNYATQVIENKKLVEEYHKLFQLKN